MSDYEDFSIFWLNGNPSWPDIVRANLDNHSSVTHHSILFLLLGTFLGLLLYAVADGNIISFDKTI
ncbi:MAG: hypothetical protein H0U27_08330 [Nitrosopumilus sp.]|nr:hypothetical protein [Nitrosopumilus sp.]